MILSLTTLLALTFGCGGFKSGGGCEDGYALAEDGNCYSSDLDDTGTSSDGDLDGDADGGPSDGDGGSDGGSDIEDGDCSSTITGLSSTAWAASENMAMLIGIPSGHACDDVTPLGDYLGTMLLGLLSPYSAGVDGEFTVTHGAFEDPNVDLTYIEAPAGSGEPTTTTFNDGTLTLTAPAMSEGGLFGTLSASGSGMTLTGDFSACWCEALVTEVDTFLTE